MKNKIFKISLAGLLAGSLYAGEIQTGKGTFEIKGGFIGLDESINTDVTTYSMVEEHKNFGSSSWFYKYNFTWYDSDQMIQAQSTINGYSDGFLNNPVSLTVPSIDYRLQGMDLNLVLGKDLSHKSENDYFGAGVMLGISIPWIESKKDENNNDTLSDDSMDLMAKSNTKIFTYKVGPSFTARKSLNRFFSVYGSATYAYQRGTFKNDYAESDLTVNGIFQEYDVGISVHLFSSEHDLGWITVSPRLYATLGYRYTSWDLDDVNIDITGTNTTFNQANFKMNSSIAYFGIGYSF